MRKTILVDMDGVLCKWTEHFNYTLQTDYPHLDFPFFKPEKNVTWDLGKNLTEEHNEAILATKNKSGFYRALEPIEGGREALNGMLKHHDVFIVTSPWPSNPTCASDKLDWLEEHIGQKWAERAVVTSDKTIVRGDYLIDDKPNIHGAMTPQWKQILFTQPYNASLKHLKRLDTWADWVALDKEIRNEERVYA